MDESLASRTIELEVDSSTGQLGSRPLRGIQEGNQRVEGGDFMKWGVRADVMSLQHGLYKKKPATLIAFEFLFLCDDGSRGFSEAKITVTFDKLQDSHENKEQKDQIPIVARYCPKLLEGPVTKGGRSSEIELHASLGLDALPMIKPEIGISCTTGVEYVRDYTMKIKGTHWSTTDFGPYNQVKWTLTESSLQGDGIPTDFRAAVLLQHSGQPYQGTVKIQAKTKLMGLRLFGWPWSIPNPLLFNPDVSFGLPIGVSNFDQLTDEHWIRLCDVRAIVSAYKLTHESDLVRQSIPETES